MKFKLGQEVFFLDENKVKNAAIQCFQSIQNLDCSNDPSVKKQSQVFAPFGPSKTLYGTCLGVFPESMLFSTKEELLASL